MKKSGWLCFLQLGRKTRNNRIRTLAGIASAVMLLLATGCSTTHGDDKITSNVREYLDNDPAYRFPDVNVNTHDGVVQLSGFVSVQGQKDRAQQLAEYTPGVRHVINGITLKPERLPATGGHAPPY